MQQHIDCSKEKQFQYIFSIIRGKGEPFYTSDGIAMFPSLIRLTDPLEAMDIFAERYNNNEIEFPFKYGSYIAADDLQDIIKGLQLDADAFWLLIMFCFDYAYSVCLTGFTYNDNEKETIEKFLGKMRLYQCLPPHYQKSVPKLLITDTQINSVAKAYMQDENFGSFGNNLSMWKFYNLLTGANKSSYIDSFLDRAYNATEIATGINAALYGDERYKWFID